LTGSVVVDVNASANSLSIDDPATAVVVSARVLSISGALMNNGGIQVPPSNWLYVNGGVTDNGTIELTSGTAMNSGPIMRFTGTQQTLSGSGTIVLNSPPDGFYTKYNVAQLSLYATVTQTAGHTISGAGAIVPFAQLINQGLINANVPGETLSVQNASGPTPVVNSGTLEATNGGTLTIWSINNSGGTILASAGTIGFLGGTISSGTLATTGSSLVSILAPSNYYATLSGVTLASNSLALVAAGDELYISNGIRNNGTIVVSSGSYNQSPNGIVSFSDAGAEELSGNGSIALGEIPVITTPRRLMSADRSHKMRGIPLAALEVSAAVP